MPERALQVGMDQRRRPERAIDYLRYIAAFRKTRYELACLREAQNGGSTVILMQQKKRSFWHEQLDINIAYLTATGHRDTDVPYGDICR